MMMLNIFNMNTSHPLCKHTTMYQGLYSLSGKTSYRKISWSLEAARFGFKLFQSLWNLESTSAALLPRCLSNFRAIRPLQHPISRLRGFTRFGGKTSYRLVNRGPELGLNLADAGSMFLLLVPFTLCMCFSHLYAETPPLGDVYVPVPLNTIRGFWNITWC